MNDGNGTAVAIPKDTLPANFERMSEKKQKAIIVGFVAEMNNEISNIDSGFEETQRKIKALKRKIENSAEGKELRKLMNGKSDDGKRKQYIMLERQGALRLARKLGFDVGEEIKKLKEL